MEIRSTDFEEAVQVLSRISEFCRGETVESLRQRIGRRPNLVLVAEKDGELLGVKIGYQLDDDCFYSWLGGVVPEGRRQGIANMLLIHQEQWAKEKGYKEIRVKSRNRFTAMLCMLLNNGYQVEHLEKKDGVGDYRLHFVKHLI
ncbi:GNAT family N-acetyltransferase [Parasalinivibrio latis]|uniref:GNAT family N-acetyltransferase n=1 Tax=Parasalinivibrio latis TaxID=2952610 RepID=UPI0030DE810B